MKGSKKTVRLLSITLAAALSCGAFAALAGCTGSKKDELIIMTQELNGLYNPFYSTAGTDMDVVGQTQISMFSTDEGGDIAYGDNEAVVVKDFSYAHDDASDITTYTFVIKNGILFSDGKPLTMNDVLFNMYVYLDPAYTGSSTMYSTDIVGLQKYRTQQNISGDGNEQDAVVNQRANNMASIRRSELIDAYTRANEQISGVGSTNFDVDETQMREFLSTYKPSDSYRKTIWRNGVPAESERLPGESDDDAARRQLLADYEETLRLFKEELNNDYNAAKDAYSGSPYRNVDSNGDGKIEITNESSIDFSSEVVSFMYMEGYIKLAYARDEKTGVEDKNHIVDQNSQNEKSTKNYNVAKIELSDAKKAREAAINYVYTSKVSSELHIILEYWATGGTLLNNYIGKAKDIILHQQLGDNSLPYANVEGIRSLGHKVNATGNTAAWEYSEDSIIVNGTPYRIAKQHKEDGTPANEEEYDVLQISIKGTDPKAIWNFGFSVAPYHYYSDPSKYEVDIENNKFGVEWGSFDFHQKVLQGTSSKEFGSVSKNMIPVGAGPYVATNRSNADNPGDLEFFTDNIVYYKANKNFLMGEPKTKKLRYVVVSSSNALDRLVGGGVDFVEPQFTPANEKRINEELSGKGFKPVSFWQLGYGYIGINAGKVPDINLRKAIMSAMNTNLALQYYGVNATTIAWPMSLVSWAYPRLEGTSFNPNRPLDNKETNTGKDYTMWAGDEIAKQNIRKYMTSAGVSAGDSKLKLKFTIAGSNLTEHPCYQVFKHAMDLLNECGWNVEVEPDLNALSKLATGSLTVWAAAWGSTIDPDMYQVYHKNSTASSVFAWGYREILANPTGYSDETKILNKLSALIDQGREIDSTSAAGKEARAAIYKQAMGYVLDLAVELPVYQRKTLYVFNSKTINVDTLTVDMNADGTINGNSYMSPLSRIWEVELVK